MSPIKQRLAITGLIVLGILFAGFFGMRAFRAFKHIHEDGFGPGHRPPPPSETNVELIRDWMTIPYIAKNLWRTDRMLFKELNISDKGNLEKSLKKLNDEYFPGQNGYVLGRSKKSHHQPSFAYAPIAPAP